MSDNNEVTQFGKFREMALRGSAYREHKEYDLYGEPAVLPLKPLVDEVYYGLLFRLDVDEEEVEAAVEHAENDEGDVEMDELDPEMITVLQEAAVLGIDAEAMGATEEEVQEVVSGLVGGVSVQIGSDVLELSAGMIDAEKFRR